MMAGKNMVYIAKSLDGYIADENDGLAWLDEAPNPENSDMGYHKFMEGIDALVMGRRTFEVVCGFDIEWPYKKPVFVLSNTLSTIPDKFKEKTSLVNGPIPEVVKQLNQQGYNRLYIDGGATIQSFLKEDIIDEMIITTLPILLGGGIPLFTKLPQPLRFEHIRSEVHLNALVQDHYRRKR